MFPITVVKSFSETPQNDQTDSNNPSAFADELFECVSPFCGVGTYRVNLYTLLYLTCCFHSPLNKHCNFLQYALFYISTKPIRMFRLKLILKVRILKAYAHTQKYP